MHHLFKSLVDFGFMGTYVTPYYGETITLVTILLAMELEMTSKLE